MCSQIHTGDVTLMDLTLMKENDENLKILIETMPKKKLILQKVQQRLLEYESFTKRLNNLRKLCQNINIKVKGT